MTPPPAGGLRAVLAAFDGRDRTDAELLARFVADRDPAAFAALVRRHGPMVLGVCRRLLGSADADDAFQAVFVVLHRRAAAVRRPNLVGPWLYRVAYRVGHRARRTAARRRRWEVAMADPPDTASRLDAGRPDWADLLDAELAGLPEWYRLPIVLCDLQGLSRADAAERLGVPAGTVSSRLANGRKKLAARLAGRGVTPAALAAFLADHARAGVSLRLFDAMFESAGPPSAAVAVLAREGVFPMRSLMLFAAVAAMTAAGLALTAGDDPKPKPKPDAKKVEVKEEPAPRFEFSKPRMVGYQDLSRPAMSLKWGADTKQPYLFVEFARGALSGNEVVVFRPGEEAAVTQCVLPTGHRLLDVFPDKPTLLTGRVDTGGINALREVRYLTSRLSLDGMSMNGREKMRNEKNGKFIETEENGFGEPKNWLELNGPQEYVGRVTLDAATTPVFRLTPDAKGLWNVYDEREAPDAAARTGLRRLHPITGDVEKKLPMPINTVGFDRAGKFAATTHDGKLRGATALTGWNLDTGKSMWTAELGDGRVPDVPAVSADGRVVAIAVETWDREKKPAELKSAAIGVFDAATGKMSNTITLGQSQRVSKLQLSPDGSLLLIEGFGPVGPLTQLFDTAPTGKRVHSWPGGGVFAFCPPRPNPHRFLLAVAERVHKDGQVVIDESPDDLGRLGLWSIDRVEVVDEK